jgi:hypothetical protein
MGKKCTIICLAILFTGVFCLNYAIAESSSGSRFVVSSDNTVLDSETGLMWASEDNGVNTNWEAAKSFCENYSAGGYTNWRLPTIEELGTIFDKNSEKKLMTFPAITLTGSCPWTSSTRKNRARTIFFMGGEANTFSKRSSNGFRALPVRNTE